MSTNLDTIMRVNAFKIALDPVASEARALAHSSVFGLGEFNDKLAGLFVEHLGNRASEVAIDVVFLREVTADVPDGIEIHFINRRPTLAPGLVKFEGAVQNLAVRSSHAVAVFKILAVKDTVVVGSSCFPTVLTAHEEGERLSLTDVPETLYE